MLWSSVVLIPEAEGDIILFDKVNLKAFPAESPEAHEMSLHQSNHNCEVLHEAPTLYILYNGYVHMCIMYLRLRYTTHTIAVSC